MMAMNAETENAEQYDCTMAGEHPFDGTPGRIRSCHPKHSMTPLCSSSNYCLLTYLTAFSHSDEHTHTRSLVHRRTQKNAHFPSSLSPSLLPPLSLPPFLPSPCPPWPSPPSLQQTVVSPGCSHPALTWPRHCPPHSLPSSGSSACSRSRSCSLRGSPRLPLTWRPCACRQGPTARTPCCPHRTALHTRDTPLCAAARHSVEQHPLCCLSLALTPCLNSTPPTRTAGEEGTCNAADGCSRLLPGTPLRE